MFCCKELKIIIIWKIKFSRTLNNSQNIADLTNLALTLQIVLISLISA